MAKIIQTAVSYEIEDTTIILDGAVQIDDFSTGLGIVTAVSYTHLTLPTICSV